MNFAASPYDVKLVDCPALHDEQRAAAELRFRMALEFAVGGRHLVLPTLQACMLAQALLEGSPDDNSEVAADGDSVDADTNPTDAVGQVIALWHKAESDAIRAALKPLGPGLANARFEIIPR